MGCDAVLGDGGAVCRIFAAMQDSAVHLGMQRLHAAVEHFRKSGEVGDVLTGIPESRSSFAVPPVEMSSTPMCGEFAGELDQAGLVGDAENCALDSMADMKGLAENYCWRKESLSRNPCGRQALSLSNGWQVRSCAVIRRCG